LPVAHAIGNGVLPKDYARPALNKSGKTPSPSICVLTPGLYVGAGAQEDDGELFEEKMRRLVTRLREQQAEARRLDEAIWKNLKGLGCDA
jgi:hypothetical protein